MRRCYPIHWPASRRATGQAIATAISGRWLDRSKRSNTTVFVPQQRATAPTLTANFPVNSCYRRQVGANISPQIIDVRGGNLPVSPKIRVGISPRWQVPVGESMKLVLQSHVNFQSRSFFSLDQDPLLKQNAYTLVDLSAAIGDADDRYTVTVFVRNLFNENYYTNLFHNPYLALRRSRLI